MLNTKSEAVVRHRMTHPATESLVTDASLEVRVAFRADWKPGAAESVSPRVERRKDGHWIQKAKLTIGLRRARPLAAA
jgi:hypothetical protein